MFYISIILKTLDFGLALKFLISNTDTYNITFSDKIYYNTLKQNAHTKNYKNIVLRSSIQ